MWWVVSSGGNLPGEAVADQGREHWDHAKLDELKYNSNPPVSGPHDADWIRPGIYGEPQDKYKLIHSLEHGYVIVHYNYAPGQVLTDFAKKMGLKKLIVQPNPTIDKPIILVAWDRMLKMDTFDEKLAEKFVKAFRNKGPEATME